MLGFDGERVGKPLDDVVRRHGAIPVHEVIEVAGGQIGLRGKAPVQNNGGECCEMDSLNRNIAMGLSTVDWEREQAWQSTERRSARNGRQE